MAASLYLALGGETHVSAIPTAVLRSKRRVSLQRFWRVHIALGFVLVVVEGTVVLLYLRWTPHGAARFPLTIVALVSTLASVGGVFSAGWVSRHPWCVRFSLAWTIGFGVILTICAAIDGGIDSPTRYLLLFPPIYASLAMLPSAVVAAWGVSMVEIALLWGLDSDLHVSRVNLLMLAGFALGAATLTLIASIQREKLRANQHELIETLGWMTMTDSLTDCANYRTFDDRLRRNARDASKDSSPLALLLCDVDDLAGYNDRFGQPAGDAALRDVATTLRSLAREGDLIARLSADEFAFLMPHTLPSEATEFGQRLLDARAGAGDDAVTVSIGIARLEADDPYGVRLLHDADAALYDAKTGGGATLVVAGVTAEEIYDDFDEPRALVRDRRRFEAELRTARRQAVESLSILDSVTGGDAMGFAYIDRNLRIVYVNHTLASINGGTPEMHIGATLPDIARDWDRLAPAYRRVLYDGESVHDVELRPSESMAEDGPTWVASLYPVRVDGQVVGVGVVAIDDSTRRKLERSYVAVTAAVVKTLSALTEARDPYTAGHQHRVSEIAEAIGRELGLDEWTVEGVGLAAAIHDIGKVSVPAEILSRPGRLSDAEMNLVRCHAEIGHDVLSDVEFPWPVAEMVYQHHERLDGSGYPRGLAGDDIHLGARIIAVADTVEAMVAHRPYRPGLGIEIALAEIVSRRGTLYDPEVVDACIALFRSGRLVLDGWPTPPGSGSDGDTARLRAVAS